MQRQEYLISRSETRFRQKGFEPQGYVRVEKKYSIGCRRVSSFILISFFYKRHHINERSYFRAIALASPSLLSQTAASIASNIIDKTEQ